MVILCEHEAVLEKIHCRGGEGSEGGLSRAGCRRAEEEEKEKGQGALI